MGVKPTATPHPALVPLGRADAPCSRANPVLSRASNLLTYGLGNRGATVHPVRNNAFSVGSERAVRAQVCTMLCTTQVL